MKLEKTNHSYYCHTGNYYSNEAHELYNSWDEFKSAWGADNIDLDYNMVFRYDIVDGSNGTLTLLLFFILQRKGIFKPVEILNLKKPDMHDIEIFLSKCRQYIFDLWDIEQGKIKEKGETNEGHT